MLIPTNTLILVTDGAKLILYRNQGTANEPELSAVKAVEQKLPNAAEMGADAPGRSFQSFSTRRSAMEMTDPHDKAEAQFAENAADQVKALVSEGEKLILIADPKTLGIIRKNLDNGVRQKLMAEIDADYSRHAPPELAKILSNR